MDITELREQFPNPLKADDRTSVDWGYCIGGALCLYFDYESPFESFENGAFPDPMYLRRLLHTEFGLPYFRDKDFVAYSFVHYNQCSDNTYNPLSRCKNTECFTDSLLESAGTMAQKIIRLNDDGEFEKAWKIIEGLSPVK